MARQQKNFLEMIPEKNVVETIREDEKLTLLIPKFKSTWLQKWLIPPRRSKYIRVRLDRTGTLVWDAINGKRSTAEICSMVHHALPPETIESDIDLRVTEYLRNLYKHRLILFKE